LAKRGAAAIPVFEELLIEAAIVVVPFDRSLADAAFAAFRRYGKGQGHPAQLNIFDCAAYALADSHGLPLLFKGADFTHTDVIRAVR
jgi:ribonuclease VapC